MRPTEEAIDAAILDRTTRDTEVVYDYNDLWSSVAYDPQGQWQGLGFGNTPAEARAEAWIEACFYWSDCDLQAFPRVVPEGWIFNIYAPGEGPPPLGARDAVSPRNGAVVGMPQR